MPLPQSYPSRTPLPTINGPLYLSRHSKPSLSSHANPTADNPTAKPDTDDDDDDDPHAKRQTPNIHATTGADGNPYGQGARSNDNDKDEYDERPRSRKS
ncbi:uncharacterized protein K452DRAFT_289470 [Aplosporella prunicola CBS 121167]|uniref:Uncharacterized protein n=1 Tax=Aplosporella prunicola CBS 121167 TaxID=1176127 RepID=A0A6A6B9T8_9PEZI|nr:uncharacterized protein K452DRAFT_289470 [Aplosporella prunicola CBS 121167]KAF2140075.1 hypothetical protein K452DRAFT_289470 [Aplosporella prunicola CBS 121167]